MFNLSGERVPSMELLEHYLGIELDMNEDHVTESFDLTKTDDLKQAFQLSIGAYLDYYNYMCAVSRMNEQFCESVEFYDTVPAVKIGLTPDGQDTLSEACSSYLTYAFDEFSEIADSAEDYLSTIIKIILITPHAVQHEILGNAYNIGSEEIDECLDILFTAFEDAPYHNTIEDNVSAFLDVLKEAWSELVLPKQ